MSHSQFKCDIIIRVLLYYHKFIKRGGFMKRMKIFMLLCLCSVFIITISGLANAADKCPLCGMNIAGNENTSYEITFADGKKVTYCCPHCGLWVQSEDKKKIKSARARDFMSGEWMDPAKMTFLFNSSAVPACSPSWIAFGKEDEAKKFQKGFGGQVFSFENALKERAKHPKGMEMPKGMKMK
jgi:nitrous oxide reductase accessory protein NosL